MDIKRVFLIGDVHGSPSPVQLFYEREKDILNGNELLVLLGDSGLNYWGNKRDNVFKEELSSLPLKYFVLRGNHDRRPSTVDGMKKVDMFGNKVYVEDAYPNIFYAMDDVQLYNILGYKTLVIPGAYSVDKYYRLQMHYNWFEDEQLTDTEMNNGLLLCENMNWECDVVLSHTCPVSFMPYDLFLPQVDQSTVDRTMEQYLGSIEYKLNYKLWAWGHYHAYRLYPKEGDKQKVMLFNDRVIDMKQWVNGSISYY